MHFHWYNLPAGVYCAWMLVPAALVTLSYRVWQRARLDSLEWLMLLALAWLGVALTVTAGVLAMMATAAVLNWWG